MFALSYSISSQLKANMLKSLGTQSDKLRSKYCELFQARISMINFFLGTMCHPELTRSIPLRNHRPFTASRSDSVGTPSEKKPMISSMPRPPPTQREYYMQISPQSKNCDHHDYMQIGMQIMLRWL